MLDIPWLVAASVPHRLHPHRAFFPVSLSLCVLLLFLLASQSMDVGSHLNYCVCKNLVSKRGHMLRLSGREFWRDTIELTTGGESGAKK